MPNTTEKGWRDEISNNYGSFKYCREVDQKGHDALLADISQVERECEERVRREIMGMFDKFSAVYGKKLEDCTDAELLEIINGYIGPLDKLSSLSSNKDAHMHELGYCKHCACTADKHLSFCPFNKDQ